MEGKLPMNPYRHDIFLQGMRDHAERFIGLHEEIEGLLARVSGARPAAISMVGPWGIGKSFTLQFLADPLGARRVFAHAIGERFRDDPERLCFVLIDSGQHIDAAAGGQFLEQLYAALLAHLADLFAIPDARLLPLDRLPAGPEGSVAALRALVQRRLVHARAEADDHELHERFEAALGVTVSEQLEALLHRLDAWNLRVIFLIDSFDSVAARLSRSDFDMLRALLANAAMVVATRQALSKLATDSAQSSPFFNLLERMNLVSLHFLSVEEAQRLIVEPPSWFATTADFCFSPSDVGFILELTGTHPDIVRASCEYLYTWARRRTPVAAADRLPPAERPYLRVLLRPLFADSFAALWHRLDPAERTTLADIASRDYADEQPYVPPGATLSRLIERGYVVYEQGGYRLFAGLFHDFALEQQPGPSPAAKTPPVKAGLTELETKFLDLLRERPGAVVERDRIIAALYGVPPDDPKQRSYYSRLDALIFRLRSKLEDEPLIIENFRGQGYRLVLTR